MTQKRILVPLGLSGKDLKSVHYALSLAERLHAQVFILQQWGRAGSANQPSIGMNEALRDLITSARQAGLTVSHHQANGEFSDEMIGMVTTESIDLLVLEADDVECQRLVPQIKPLIASPIIEVKGKNHISYL
ncbi:MAG: universal stress protein [Pseudomonadota bacterium]